MSADNRLKTVTGLSSLWDGKPISRVRASEAPIKLYDKRLAFHLMIQPAIAYNLFGDNALVDQGFMSRCLLAYPESTMGKRPYVAENIYESDVYLHYANKMTNLLASRPHHASTLALSPGALEMYFDFYDQVELELCEGGECEPIAGFVNKMVNQALRIAGILAIYENPRATEVSQTHLLNGCILMRYYQSEAMRLIGEAPIHLKGLAEEQKLIHAKRLLDWINQPKVINKHFSDGLIKKKSLSLFAPRPLRKKDTLMSLVEVLVEYGYLIPAGGATNIWELNNAQ